MGFLVDVAPLRRLFRSRSMTFLFGSICFFLCFTSHFLSNSTYNKDESFIYKSMQTKEYGYALVAVANPSLPFVPSINAQATPAILISRALSVDVGIFFLISVYNCISSKEISATKDKLETKKNLVRFVSHETRTPLNLVVMGLELLERNLKKNNIYDDELTEIVKETKASCTLAVETLTDILDYEKLDGGIMKLEKGPLNVMQLLSEIMSPFLLQAYQKGVHLQLCDEQSLHLTLRDVMLILYVELRMLVVVVVLSAESHWELLLRLLVLKRVENLELKYQIQVMAYPSVLE
eukprot:gene1143-2210_t